MKISDLQGVFVKIGDFVLCERFSSGIFREQALLRKSKTPRKSPEKWTSLSLAFYNALSLQSVDFKHNFKPFFTMRICRHVDERPRAHPMRTHPKADSG